MFDTLAGGEGFLDPTHDCVSGLNTRPLRHPDIDHELVALGGREKLLRHYRKEHDPNGDGTHSHGESQPLFVHEDIDQYPVFILKPIE